jgi:Holliday junction resolvase RusA-like endonuclease
MTGIVYRDDAQITEVLAAKAYAESAGVDVVVSEVGPGGL